MPYPYKICEECGEQFTPKDPRRVICYDPCCIEARRKRWSRAAVDRRSQMKAGGEWKQHTRKVKGIGTGNSRRAMTGKFRICLSCCNSFEVPEGTDFHICLACHTINNHKLDEFSEGALGLKDSPIREPGSLGDGGRRELCHSTN